MTLIQRLTRWQDRHIGLDGYVHIPVVTPVLTWLVKEWLSVNGWESKNGHLVRKGDQS